MEVRTELHSVLLRMLVAGSAGLVLLVCLLLALKRRHDRTWCSGAKQAQNRASNRLGPDMPGEHQPGPYQERDQQQNGQAVAQPHPKQEDATKARKHNVQ